MYVKSRSPARSSDGAVKSARRVLVILELLTAREKALTFSEIAEATGFPLSSLHGLMRTLVDSEWASYDKGSRRYSLGIRTLEAGDVYRRATGLADRALPVMRQIRDEIHETVQLAVLSGRYCVYVAKVDGGRPVRLDSEVGRRLPAHATGIGKMLLSGLSEPQLRRLLDAVELEKFNEHTISDLDELEVHLADVRRKGFSIDREEYTEGIYCAARPILDSTGAIVAAMSVSALKFRFDRTRVHHALALLGEGTAAVSAELGYQQGRPISAD